MRYGKIGREYAPLLDQMLRGDQLPKESPPLYFPYAWCLVYDYPQEIYQPTSTLTNLLVTQLYTVYEVRSKTYILYVGFFNFFKLN